MSQLLRNGIIVMWELTEGQMASRRRKRRNDSTHYEIDAGDLVYVVK